MKCQPVTLITAALILTSIFSGCVSSTEGVPQEKSTQSRPADWEGDYSNASDRSATRTLSRYLQLPPAADTIRITPAGNGLTFQAMQAGQVLDARNLTFENDPTELILREKSDGGKMGHVAGAGKVTETTVLFRNRPGDLVVAQRVRGAAAVYYVIPIGFRQNSFAVFKRKTLPTTP